MTMETISYTSVGAEAVLRIKLGICPGLRRNVSWCLKTGNSGLFPQAKIGWSDAKKFENT
jgi:hypothetical protein